MVENALFICNLQCIPVYDLALWTVLAFNKGDSVFMLKPFYNKCKHYKIKHICSVLIQAMGYKNAV